MENGMMTVKRCGGLCLFVTIALLSMSVIDAQGITWSNDGPYGGWIREVAVDPIDTSIVYAGTYGHGLFKSYDSGGSWVEMSNGLPMWPNSIAGSPGEPNWGHGDFFPIEEIYIHPVHSNNLLAATGRGVYRSSDGGAQWVNSSAGLPDSARVCLLTQMTGNPEVLFAGTRWLAYGIGMEDGGLFISTDGGRHWTLVENFPHGSSYYPTSVAAHPDSEGIVYAGFSSAGESDTSWGLWRSEDSGDSWEILADYPRTAIYLSIDHGNPFRMYCIFGTGYNQSLLHTSINGGHGWEPLFPDGSWETAYLCLNTDAQPSILYVSADRDRLMSVDQGKTWVSAFAGIGMSYYGVNDLAVNPQSPEVLYVGNEMGVYRSDDGGSTVEFRVDGMKNTYIHAVAVHPTDGQTVYAGGERGGMWKSVDAGKTWTIINQGASFGEVNAIAIDPHHPDTLYRAWDGIHRSYDGGEHWEKIGGGWITAVAVRPDSTNIVFCAPYSSTLRKSTDRGQSWRTVFSAAPHSEKINAIVFHPQKPQIVYLGTGYNLLGHGLYRSVDGGESWEKISDPGLILSLAIDSVHPEILYAGTTMSGLKKSTDGGLTFTSKNSDPLGQWITDVVMDPQKSDVVYVATGERGVFRSTNGGDEWTTLEGDLGDPRTRSLSIAPSTSNILYVGTYGSGVWKARGIGTPVEPFLQESGLPKEYHLSCPYPNPFNASTTITYTVPEPSEVSLMIFNIRGQLVTCLKEGIHTSGRHVVHWDGRDGSGMSVASGIYLVVLQAGDDTRNRKIVLLR
jgi:photosystem II stability/assembly factor-like uncharacterized protein